MLIYYLSVCVKAFKFYSLSKCQLIIQCYQLYLLWFILDPSDSTSCELEGPRKREVLFHFSQTEKCQASTIREL